MQSLRTSAKSALSMYLIPPQARLDEFMLVRPAKSPRSISATCAPLPARAAALTAPLMPPPTTSTSKRGGRSFVRLFFRSCMRLELQYAPAGIVRERSRTYGCHKSRRLWRIGGESDVAGFCAGQGLSGYNQPVSGEGVMNHFPANCRFSPRVRMAALGLPV